MHAVRTSIEDFDEKIQYGSQVVFDWDNTLKIINHEKKTLESRVATEYLMHLIKKKRCELFIISAIRPSRMNLDTLLMEVDKLGLKELFCPEFQRDKWHEINKEMLKSTNVREDSKGVMKSNTHVLDCSDGKMYAMAYNSPKQYSQNISSSGQNISSSGHCQNLVPQQIPTMCTHGTQPKEVRGTYHYAHWGNIIACGYDKAEVFLEHIKGLDVQVDSVDAEEDEGFAYEAEEEEADGIEDETEMKPVVFFDDEEVNIFNFQHIVKHSYCVLVK